jgi:hypothetical protein
LLSERSQSEIATYYLVPNILHSGKGKTKEMIKKISGCQEVRGQGISSHNTGFLGQCYSLYSVIDYEVFPRKAPV